MGIANHSNRKALFGPRMTRLQHVFPNIKLNVLRKPPKSWKVVKDLIAYDFEEIFFNLPKQNIVITGNLLSFRYFVKISSWLYREVFSHINQTLFLVARNFTHQAMNDYSNKQKGVVPKTVCVHVRRGDKANHRTYRLPSPEEILNAVNYMESKHKHVVFIVASDTTKWCKQHLPKHNVYISSLTTLYEDFVLLSSCDDMIMTEGTFGWWAAWLTSKRGGTSMYYNHPFFKSSRLDKYLDRKDHFPAKWIAYNSTSIIKSKE